MKPDFAKAADPVFVHVLDLLDRLQAGEKAHPEEEHRQIVNVLEQAEGSLGSGNEEWRAAKFALACWIDELLSSSAVWSGADYWCNKPLERVLFKSADRALEFYRWAKQAAEKRQHDALEVYYVCAILGFRGMYNERDEVVADFVKRFDLTPTFTDWLGQAAASLQRRHVPPIHPTGKIPRGARELHGYSLFMATLLGCIGFGALLALLAALASR